jgi:Fic family protein
MMFLIVEVHPFADGNGRVARILMNAELYSQGLSTIIIPNVYREDYLLALRALTRRSRTAPFIRMMTRAQKFSSVEFSPYKKILTELESRNWFRDPDDAKLID